MFQAEIVCRLSFGNLSLLEAAANIKSRLSRQKNELMPTKHAVFLKTQRAVQRIFMQRQDVRNEDKSDVYDKLVLVSMISNVSHYAA